MNVQLEGLEKNPRFRAFRGQLEIGTQGKSDIVFVLDESGSIRKERFPMESVFVKVIARLIGISAEKNRISVISYASSNRVRFNYILNTVGNNMCTLMNKDIPAIPESYSGGGTRTSGALVLARDMLVQGRTDTNR